MTRLETRTCSVARVSISGNVMYQHESKASEELTTRVPELAYCFRVKVCEFHSLHQGALDKEHWPVTNRMSERHLLHSETGLTNDAKTQG